MLIENMIMAFSALRANKMRSFLTMLGIIIGIGSVISIVSIGDTMRGMFSSLYQDIGITQAYLGIGYWIDDTRQSDYFTMDELSRIKSVFGDKISYIDSAMSTSADAVAGRKKVKFGFSGLDYNYIDVQPVDILYGRYLNEADVKARKTNAVLDVDSAKMLFGTEDAVGKTFRTELFGNVAEFTVVGVYEKKMSAFQKLMMGTPSDKGTAHIPWTLLTWPNDHFYYCHFFADTSMSEAELNTFYDDLLSYVAKLKDRKKSDFYMETAISQMGQVDSMMAGLSLAVGGIAAISLIVGGIGIMNIMLVSVTERTREIGIRKALGATYNNILLQFLIEAMVIGVVGGTLGVILGIGSSYAISYFAGWQTVISIPTIIIAVVFSVGIGLFFGIYPARKAALLDPIEALRYE